MKEKYKHLTIEDRKLIERGLDLDKSAKEIASWIGKDPTTISKEVKLNRFLKPANPFNQKPEDYQMKFNKCTRLKCYPNVCNGCPLFQHCRKDKYLYISNHAYNKYKENLSFSRIGIHMDDDQFDQVDSIIKTGLDNGQPLYHIWRDNLDVMPKSIKTVYNWINRGQTTSIRLDLRRAVSYRQRFQIAVKPNDTGIYEGRSFTDYEKYRKENPKDNYTEMDCVEGLRHEPKTILTFLLQDESFLLAYVMNEHTCENVLEIFNKLELELGIEQFRKLIGVILTDRGPEFSNPNSLEFSPFTGERRCRIFYCDPMHSHQKGAIENKHRFIRYFFPKKTSIQNVSQKQINTMVSHINGIRLEKLNGKTPYSLALKKYGAQILDLLRIKYIPPHEINLNKKQLG